jgi:glyoxylase I family protein
MHHESLGIGFSHLHAQPSDMPDVTGIDHIYVAVSDLDRSDVFYGKLLGILGFRRNSFELNGAPHVQYYNRHFGYVLRPAGVMGSAVAGTVGLHHFCLRVDSVEDVYVAARQLQAVGIAASEPKHHPEYAPDYVATFIDDPDGLRLEITNYRAERRYRHDHWDDLTA